MYCRSIIFVFSFRLSYLSKCLQYCLKKKTLTQTINSQNIEFLAFEYVIVSNMEFISSDV